jgi:hypothetical protein
MQDDITTYDLKYVIVVAQEGSLSRTAPVFIRRLLLVFYSWPTLRFSAWS